MRGKCECSLRIRLTGDGCRYCQPQGYIDMLLEQIDEEARQPSTGAQPAPGAEAWIPVTERLPARPAYCTPSTKYLTVWDDGSVEAAWYCDTGDWQRSNGDMDYHGETKVTHWQPLPAPPVAAHSPKE